MDGDADGRDGDDFIEEISAINQLILKSIKHHACPPSALGSQNSGLEQKTCAVLHSCRLELHTNSQLNLFNKTVVSFTRDLGTEHLMSDAKISTDLSDLVPGFNDVPGVATETAHERPLLVAVDEGSAAPFARRSKSRRFVEAALPEQACP